MLNKRHMNTKPQSKQILQKINRQNACFDNTLMVIKIFIRPVKNYEREKWFYQLLS